jgi:hypothetical protein
MSLRTSSAGLSGSNEPPGPVVGGQAARLRWQLRSRGSADRRKESVALQRRLGKLRKLFVWLRFHFEVAGFMLVRPGATKMLLGTRT